MDDKIKEVMRLVDTYGEDCELFGISHKTVNYDQLMKSRALIESKLRELVPVWLPIESAPHEEYVLVFCKNDGVSVAEKSDGRWFDDCGLMHEDPTHWMPLPKEPV